MNGIWLFSWKTVPKPRSWSLGNCVHCEQLQPIRISDHIKIFSFALLPLSRQIVGQSCCCDFCLHEMRVGPGLRETDLANWPPGEGARRLFERAVKDYGVDPRRIQQLAADYSQRTQAAARALY